MATAKKATAAKKKAEPKEPEPVTVDGFETKEYEGLDLLVCERCGFDTFDQGSAKAHAADHGKDEAAAAEVADLTQNLATTAQVTTEEEPDVDG